MKVNGLFEQAKKSQKFSIDNECKPKVFTLLHRPFENLRDHNSENEHKCKNKKFNQFRWSDVHMFDIACFIYMHSYFLFNAFRIFFLTTNDYECKYGP